MYIHTCLSHTDGSSHGVRMCEVSSVLTTGNGGECGINCATGGEIEPNSAAFVDINQSSSQRPRQPRPSRVAQNCTMNPARQHAFDAHMSTVSLKTKKNPTYRSQCRQVTAHDFQTAMQSSCSGCLGSTRPSHQPLPRAQADARLRFPAVHLLQGS